MLVPFNIIHICPNALLQFCYSLFKGMIRNQFIFGILSHPFHFLTFFNKVENRLCIRFLCLSVRLSVCTSSNSCKYSSNILKFIHDVHIRFRKDRSENGMYGSKVPWTETQKSFPTYHGQKWYEYYTILHTGSRKSFSFLWGKFFKAHFNMLIRHKL